MENLIICLLFGRYFIFIRFFYIIVKACNFSQQSDTLERKHVQQTQTNSVFLSFTRNNVTICSYVKFPKESLILYTHIKMSINMFSVTLFMKN